MVKTGLGSSFRRHLILPSRGARPKRRRHGQHQIPTAFTPPDNLAMGTAYGCLHPSPRNRGCAVHRRACGSDLVAGGPDAYATFLKYALNPIGLVVLVGLTWSFFQHLLSGIRHLVMDSGAGFELNTNKRFAILTIVGSVLLTLLVWAYWLGVRP